MKYLIYNFLFGFLGIGRTGTFCTLDIAIRKFEDTEKIDIKRTGSLIFLKSYVYSIF